jgi:hypothetical protein
MYKHTPTTPDWLYRPAAIPEEKMLIFSKELHTLHTITQQKTPSIPPNTTCFMMVFDLSKFDQLCPELNYFLSQEWGIRDHLREVAFVCLSHDLPMQLHVDGIEIDIALNMPVLNCHNSFTVWHDTDPENQQLLMGYYNYNTIDSGASEKLAIAFGPTSELTEIGRCSVNKPHWININVPHQAQSDHSQFRVNASFRFNRNHINPDNLSNKFYVA